MAGNGICIVLIYPKIGKCVFFAEEMGKCGVSARRMLFLGDVGRHCAGATYDEPSKLFDTYRRNYL